MDQPDERLKFASLVDVNFTKGLIVLLRVFQKNNRTFTRAYSVPFETGFNEVNLREFLKDDIPAPSIIRPDGSEGG